MSEAAMELPQVLGLPGMRISMRMRFCVTIAAALLFVCDAPRLHASASRLAAFWSLVLINPASKTLKAANKMPETPSCGPPRYSFTMRRAAFGSLDTTVDSMYNT
ncbi:hypothetical protein Trco_005931 [Trichoderma cornu-damae]|uniref:Uncharacterized protein n=1 Tax=Trichoderma cornu-damae TaxID=654480 RepID=A0A9P8QQA8_9HYPO|nr:hypothetical protein Trco_005931 [Trichoderma cornu-damae]